MSDSGAIDADLEVADSSTVGVTGGATPVVKAEAVKPNPAPTTIRDKDAKKPVQVAQAGSGRAKAKPSKADGFAASLPDDLTLLLGLLLLILAAPMLWLRRRKTA